MQASRLSPALNLDVITVMEMTITNMSTISLNFRKWCLAVFHWGHCVPRSITLLAKIQFNETIGMWSTSGAIGRGKPQHQRWFN